MELVWGTRSIWVKGNDGELRPSAKYWPEFTNKELMERRLFCPCGIPFSRAVYPRNVILHCTQHKKKPAITEMEAAEILTNLWKEPAAPNFFEPRPKPQQKQQQQPKQRTTPVKPPQPEVDQRHIQIHNTPESIAQNGLCCEPEEPEVNRKLCRYNVDTPSIISVRKT